MAERTPGVDLPVSDLPPLPKPDVRCGEYAGPPGEGASEDYYTADQMREYALAACGVKESSDAA